MLALFEWGAGVFVNEFGWFHTLATRLEYSPQTSCPLSGKKKKEIDQIIVNSMIFHI